MPGLHMAIIDNDDEKQKFESLYNKHKNMLYSVAFAILQDCALSEDAVHETFLSLARNMGKISERSDNEIKNYLIVIARNAALKIYNKNKNEICTEDDNETIPDISDVQTDIENRDLQKRLFNMVKSMDKCYGDVLMLKYFYDLSLKDIAKSLGITVNNVKIRLHRGKNMLKEQLLKEGIV